MSYHRPYDQYAQSNASQYDTRYQQGAYNDDAYGSHNNQGGYGAANYYNDTPGTGYGDGAYEGPAYKDYSSSASNLRGAGAAGAPAANAAKYSYAPTKKPKSKWIKIGIPVLLILLICIGVGVGIGVWQGTKNSKGSAKSTGGAAAGGSSGNEPATVPQNVLAAASAAAKQGGTDDLVYQGTDLYGNPSFKSSATTAAPTANGQQVGNCADDSFSGSTTNVRPHPRIMTTAAQWECLPNKIANDAYLTVWNYTLFENATTWLNMPPTNYSIDGGFDGSGILDPAREVQMRVKTFAYAYRLSGNDTKWLNRCWQELQAAAGNSTEVVWGATAPSKDRIWNPNHFLDTAELTAAFAIGYDWLYDAWTPDQRTKLAWSIITQGLIPGSIAYGTTSEASTYGWWKTTNGNWNCVSNSGLLLGALALVGEDPSNGVAAGLIPNVLSNMKQNCMNAVYEDGTWSETANYWYFGSNGQARALSALTTATGSDQGLMAANPNWAYTGLFHMYVSGMASMFFYGDNGPNKYSTNANGMFLWGQYYKNPLYALFQRDRADAPDPLSMFWYDTSSKGAFWNGLALDKFFDNTLGQWASMRASWTDFTAMYVAIKASNGTGHQTHGDLDAGDFVIDALGTRWAGEFGSGNYLSTDYFASEAQNAVRWEYYRKGTQGQNAIVINKQNQQSSCMPVNTFQTTNVTQTGDIAYTPGTNDVAFFKSDLSTAYNLPANSVQRGIRFLNARRQVLVRDEIAGSSSITDINWRVHTNATVSISADGKTATMTISQVTDPNAYGSNNYGGAPTLVSKLPKTQTMIVKLTGDSSSSAQFKTITPDQTYLYDQTDPNKVSGEQGDQPNPGVTLLYIDVQPNNQATVIETLWQPQWPTLSAADTASPKEVPLAQWSLTSHNQ